MERKSIQSISSSSTTRKYDVFVSFRGEDTRNNFTDHLFAAFQRKGIVAFRDDKSIKQGDHISTELMQAIEGSQVLIVVFSKNYITSSWCLEELAKIVDCLNMEVPTKPSVLPIFYDVSPSEVRKQSGDYEKAMADHEEKYKLDLGMVQRWRKALVQVANSSGWDIRNKRQYGEIKKIIERVKSILGYKLSNDLDGLVGMDSRVEQLEELMVLHSNDDVRIIGICGMGGIGKTTLARAVYGRNFNQYDASCFIDDISKTFRDGGLISAQKQLICQIMNEEIQDIWNVEASCLIKTRLCHLKALIVLDNVDDLDQLQKLGVNSDCLRAGSRIMVISRDRHILNVYGLDEVYNVQLLNEDEAHQLFCRKAFKPDVIMGCDDISREYKKLTDLALEYTKCLPLAIEVLGSFLHGRDISEWRSALARLRDNPKQEIMDVLQISFDGLEPLEKEIFLDIACFFDDKFEGDMWKILDYRGFHPKIGIRVLVDKSLLTIAEYHAIRMHDMLRELGRKIVRQNAPNEPWKWSRIWRIEDFKSFISEKMAIDNVEAIRLKSNREKPFSRARIITSRPEEEEELSRMNEEENTTVRAEALSRMNRLKLLILKGVNFLGSLNSLSNELRYLEWENYPFTYFPSNCELTKLVELILLHSNIKQLWKGTKPLYSLKMMNLSYSQNLVKTPDFSGAPNLEVLALKGCTKLVHIHLSRKGTKPLYNLKMMDLSYSQNLVKTPDFSRAPNLEVLVLRGCTKLVHIHPSIGLLRKLVDLNLGNCTSLMSLPSSIFGLSSLSTLNLQGCSKLFHSEQFKYARHGVSDTAIQCQSTISSIFKRLKLVLPFRFFNSRRHNDVVGLPMLSLAHPSCLVYLDLSYCNLLNIPDAMASLYCLQRLNLRGNNFVTLPCFIKKLPRLINLDLHHCKQLTSISEFPLCLPVQTELVGRRYPWAELSIFNCPKLVETESWSGIAPSWMIQFLKVHRDPYSRVIIVIPGARIPSWFNRQGVGDSITIEPFLNVHDNNWIGIALCATFVAHYDPPSSSDAKEGPTLRCLLHVQKLPACLISDFAEIEETNGITVELVHLCLCYFSRRELIDFKEGLGVHDLDGSRFELLAVGPHSDDLHLEVKNWGMRVVYKQDLEQLNGDSY